MSATRHRAWKFTHPDRPERDGSAGLGISARGSVDVVEGPPAIRQAILLLLSTAPGERVMRPGYGCDLFRLVFAPNDATTAGLAIHYVRRAVERWEPRVELVRVDAARSPTRPQVLEITVEYQVRATQDMEQLTFSFDLAGEEA